jgi:hypothetical protein
MDLIEQIERGFDRLSRPFRPTPQPVQTERLPSPDEIDESDLAAWASEAAALRYCARLVRLIEAEHVQARASMDNEALLRYRLGRLEALRDELRWIRTIGGLAGDGPSGGK